MELEDRPKKIAVYPCDTFAVSYSIAFPHPVIGAETLDFTPSAASYETEVAPARTFGFIAEVEMLLKNGLVHGGSLENVVVLDEERVLNPEGLRFPDEFCRHKVLDLMGDISLFGHPLIGHVVADRGGHAMHDQLVSQLLRRERLLGTHPRITWPHQHPRLRFRRVGGRSLAVLIHRIIGSSGHGEIDSSGHRAIVPLKKRLSLQPSPSANQSADGSMTR